MTKKSKLLLVLLLVLVTVLSTACSNGSADIKQPANVNGDSSVTSGADENNSSSVEIAIAETVLYEADGVKVTATGCKDGWMGPEIKLLVENSSEKSVLITTDSVSVNGYMMPFASLYAEVAAGKKANDSILLSNTELEQSGIETIADIQFYIKVSDADTWDSLATSELISLSTSAAPFQQSVDDAGDVLYDANGIKIVCKGLKQDIIWDGTIVFYMENNSGQPITVYAENVSVNGYMQDAGLWSDLRDGTRIIDGMSLLDLSDLELKSINEVENIEFSLRIINAESWQEIVTTDAITLTFA